MEIGVTERELRLEKLARFLLQVLKLDHEILMMDGALEVEDREHEGELYAQIIAFAEGELQRGNRRVN